MVSTAAGSIAERYHLLKGFYGGYMASAIIVIMSLFFGGLVYLFIQDLWISTLAFGTVIALTLLLNRASQQLFGQKCPNYTARRLDSVSVVEIGLAVTGAILSALTSFVNTFASVAVAAASTSVTVFISYSVRRAIGFGINKVYAAILSTPALTINFFTLFSYTSNIVKALQISFTAFFVGIAAMETVRYIIDRVKPIRGFKPFTLLQAFLSSLLSGESKALENMMTQLGNDEEVGCELFLIKRKDRPPVAVVVSEIHPGPFRAVGSSMFPALVQQKLANRGIYGVVLKGLSSHEKNLASLELAEKIADTVADEAFRLQASQNYSPLFGLPVRNRFDGVSSLSFEMSGKKICILTLHPNAMEDLPPEILPENQSDNVIVVDAHNSFDDNFKTLEQQTIEKIKSFLTNSREKASHTQSTFRAGFARKVPGEFGLAEGIGSGGLSCLVFESGGTFTSVIVADANNSLPWVRPAALEAAAKFRCIDAELCTTDTHMVNAVSLGGRGYHPLGEAIPREKLTQILEDIHREAVEDLAEAQVTHKTVKIRDAKVFSDFLETVSQAVSFGVKSYGAAGFSAFIIASTLSLMLI